MSVRIRWDSPRRALLLKTGWKPLGQNSGGAKEESGHLV